VIQVIDLVTSILPGMVVGFLSGGVGGALVAYWLRRKGNIRCIVPRVTTRIDSSPGATGATMKVTFTLRFYNEREVGTSLGPLSLDVYTRAGKYVTSESLKEAESGETIRFMDLPPQASGWKEIDFRMEVRAQSALALPGGRTWEANYSYLGLQGINVG
jgi:hypothetical protein